VVVRYGESDVVVEVLDDGRGISAATGDGELGQGLIGMQERAALLGGRFHAGPRPDRGYRVSVRLPIESAPA
jgi:signal transduction histidine kinase